MLRTKAKTHQEAAKAATETPASLLEFFEKTSPDLERPDHLARLASALERAAREPVELLINTPPQHGKSTLIFHFFAWVLKQWPRPLLYLTYNDEFARDQMRLCRPICERAGVLFDERNSRRLTSWWTQGGGSLYATGIGGSVTGRPGGIVVIDDPVKDWAHAQSKRLRDSIDSNVRSSVLTRLHPGSSVIIVQTRWHVDDISGRFEKEGWIRENLKAINDKGFALWERGRSLAFLKKQKKRLGANLFAAMFQGEPVPVGGSVFGSPTFYTEKPTAYRAAIGVDLAYSEKTSADYSVSLVLAQHGEFYDVIDMVRRQVQAPAFALVLKHHASRFPGAPMRFRGYGPEKGSADFIIRDGVPLVVKSPPGDKLVRAQGAAAAWNDGKIRVDPNAPWAQELIAEVQDFTGVGDVHDDIVDALGTAFDTLDGMPTHTVTASNPRKSAGLKASR